MLDRISAKRSIKKYKGGYDMLWGGAGVDILNMVSREAHQEDGCS